MATKTRRRASPFENTRKIELRYAMQLRQLAAKIGEMVASFPDPIQNPGVADQIQRALNAYANAITPWARATAARFTTQIDMANARAYAEHSRDMARRLRAELARAPTGEMMRLMQAEQVELIRSMPIEAGQRVQKLVVESFVKSERASTIAKMIQNTEGVTKTRATLIARTETARTASNLTMARAMYVGSTGYIWRTAGDSDVRPSHASMAGRVVSWDDPPELDNMRGHAGCFPNCRCWPEPIIPD